MNISVKEQPQKTIRGHPCGTVTSSTFVYRYPRKTSFVPSLLYSMRRPYFYTKRVPSCTFSDLGGESMFKPKKPATGCVCVLLVGKIK